AELVAADVRSSCLGAAAALERYVGRARLGHARLDTCTEPRDLGRTDVDRRIPVSRLQESARENVVIGLVVVREAQTNGEIELIGEAVIGLPVCRRTLILQMMDAERNSIRIRIRDDVEERRRRDACRGRMRTRKSVVAEADILPEH